MDQQSSARSRRRVAADRYRWAPWALVAAAVLWNLVNLHAETWRVTYLNDSSVHAQMVRFATAQFAQGHLPLTRWFPYLGLGSPQFLHYQSLPAMVTGLIGGVVGAGNAFRWSLYLLLSLWPVSVYAGARLFGIRRWAAAAAAVMAPFLVSATHVGYEQGAYVWIGYGVWTQLWASMTLPLAWGLSWRAIREGGSLFLAALAIAVTLALHFETGYLAIIPMLFWPFVTLDRLRLRVTRAAVVIGGALLASAWVIVPLLVERPWAATNEILQRTPLVNGYGAGRVLGWLLTGKVLDSGRLPVITIFAAIGLALAIAGWGRDQKYRGLVVALAVCLLLSFGRTTFGALADLIPGSSDIFFRRFMMGVQLAGLLLAGVGAAWCGRVAWTWLAGLQRRWSLRLRSPLRSSVVVGAVLAAVAVGLLAPAWSQSLSYTRQNTNAIRDQTAADASEGAEVDRLLAVVRRRGGGRVYAGMPTNWGSTFTVGAVPVFKFLEARDVEQVGYTLRTASLMTGPEYYFDDRNLADYLLFGVRYLIIPSVRAAPVPSVPLGCEGYYCLREVPAGGYVHVGSVVGTLALTRSNVATRSLPILRSGLPLAGNYVRAKIGGSSGRPFVLPPPTPPFPGKVISEGSDVSNGEMAATVELRRPGVAVFSASFDPGWQATVDGHRSRVLAVAPALVATRVPAGRHTVMFRYQGFSGYPWLIALSALALVALAAIDLGALSRIGGRRAHRGR